MDARTIELLALGFERLRANRDEAASLFYARLFTTAPHLRATFKDDLAAHKVKLMGSLAQLVDFYRAGLDPTSYLGRLARGPRGHGTRRAHFDLVGDALVFTLAQILGEDFTPELRAAWVTAYQEVASALIPPVDTRSLLSMTPPRSATARW